MNEMIKDNVMYIPLLDKDSRGRMVFQTVNKYKHKHLDFLRLSHQDIINEIKKRNTHIQKQEDLIVTLCNEIKQLNALLSKKTA